MSVRRANHAGQWYTAFGSELLQEFGSSISTSENVAGGKAKAIIAPHAGYKFSGQTAAAAYSNVDMGHIQRIFIMGPCHHIYVDGCALPEPLVMKYETPLGPLTVDQAVLDELRSCEYSPFKSIRLKDDEEEHSIEMQLPLIKYMLIQAKHENVPIIPIYVGSLLHNEERLLGRLLSKYFDDPSSLFVISSDFCHWGNKFRFTPSSFPSGPVDDVACVYPKDSMNGSIEALDRAGMSFIEKHDAEGFAKYLQMTGNTICGRYPIQVLLEILRNSIGRYKVEFVHYSQSNLLPKEVSRSDAVVSYAAGVCY